MIVLGCCGGHFSFTNLFGEVIIFLEVTFAPSLSFLKSKEKFEHNMTEFLIRVA